MSHSLYDIYVIAVVKGLNHSFETINEHLYIIYNILHSLNMDMVWKAKRSVVTEIVNEY